MPTERTKFLDVSSVAFPVTENLLFPKCGIGLWPLEQITFVTVPKTPVHKNSDLMPGKHQIRFSRQVLAMQLIRQYDLPREPLPAL